MNPPYKRLKLNNLAAMMSETSLSNEPPNPPNPSTNSRKRSRSHDPTNTRHPPPLPIDQIIFFCPPPNIKNTTDSINGDDGDDDEGSIEDYEDYMREQEIDCDKSDCDHEELSNCEVDSLTIQLQAITQIKDIKDLIRLGKLYHCKRRQTYMGINLKRLHLLRKPLQKLDRMIGLQKIKENIVNQIVYFLSGLQSGSEDMMHTVIEGPPGSGKTEVGRILGEVYQTMGILDKNIFKVVKRSDLIGRYLGHTAAKCQDVINSCDGGVMFIDEAYALGDNEGRDSFSKECLDTLNQNLSDNKHKFLCIIAGYTDSLEKNFFAFNDGLRRRFTFKYVIDKYTPDELMAIFMLKVKEFGWEVSPSVQLGQFFKEHYDSFPHYGGDIETLFFNMRIYHGRRIFCLDKDQNRKILTTEDFVEGFKIYSGHRKNHSSDNDMKKMKEYSMYL
jgi:hypothetical protein